MYCLLKIENNQPSGWVIGGDLSELRQRIMGLFPQTQEHQELAGALYRLESPFPLNGKHDLGNGFLLLCD